MRFLTALLALTLVCLASAYKQPERAECSVEAASKCVTEIGGEMITLKCPSFLFIRTPYDKIFLNLEQT